MIAEWNWSSAQRIGVALMMRRSAGTRPRPSMEREPRETGSWMN